MGSGWVRVREIRACGQVSQNPGLATVTVVVDPSPPGGGDLTLTGNSYTLNFTSTLTFQDVPAGDIRLEAREVSLNPEQGVTAIWAPSPALWTGTASTFAPITVRVGYTEVPGTLQVNVKGLPQGSSTQASLNGRKSRTLTLVPGANTVSLLPGSYTLSFSDTWVDDYSLYEVTSSRQVSFKISSRQTTTVGVDYRLVGGNVTVDVQANGGAIPPWIRGCRGDGYEEWSEEADLGGGPGRPWVRPGTDYGWKRGRFPVPPLLRRPGLCGGRPHGDHLRLRPLRLNGAPAPRSRAGGLRAPPGEPSGKPGGHHHQPLLPGRGRSLGQRWRRLDRVHPGRGRGVAGHDDRAGKV